MIRVEGLGKTLGEARVLRGLTFDAPAGRITGLLGPNGAGKSTTMRILATLLRPDEGRATVDGVDVADEPDEVRRIVGLVTEEPGLYNRLTVREQLRYAALAYRLAPAEVERRIEHVAGALDLTGQLDQRAGTLSKGGRQKVALARAIVHDPPVLLLDEPTSGLDVVATAGLEDLLVSEEVSGGKTVLLSTHRLDEAERLADVVVGLVGGQVVSQGSPAELMAATGATSFRDAFVTMLEDARQRAVEEAREPA